MKNPYNRLLSPFLIGALLVAGLSTASANNHFQTVTPPAVKDGSNFSRAPFPAARQFNDTTTTSSTVAAPLAVAPATVTVATVSTEPVLTPTGRDTVIVPAPAPYVVPVRRSGWPFAVTSPAIKDGSNFSRAPFPAARPFDDVKAPDGEAAR